MLGRYDYNLDSMLIAGEIVFVQRKQSERPTTSYSLTLTHLKMLHSQKPGGIRHRGYTKVI